jgi:Rgg/GadR/MutR family transcriptional activator
MLGEDFHELRERRAISLRVAAGAVTSPATLSKFENGVGDLGISHLVQCLDNMDSSLVEFASMSDPSTGNLHSFLHQAVDAYNVRNLQELRYLIEEQSDRYQQQHTLVAFHDLVSAAGLYCDITGEKLLPDADLKQLVDELTATNSWGEAEITVFGNAVGLLGDDCLLAVAKSLLLHLNDINVHNHARYQDAWTALLNTLDEFTKRGSIHADEFIEYLAQKDIPENIMLIKWRFLFLRDCRRAAVTPDEAHYAAVDHQLAFLQFVNDQMLYEHYRMQAADILGKTYLERGGDAS